jgi:pyrroloquinoline-quinone synthase
MNQRFFWQQLDARIGKYDLLCHPFYKAWSLGQLTQEDLRMYASNYYHHVAAFPEYLLALEERLHERQPQSGAHEHGLLKTLATNRADEEGAGAADHRSHAELWLDFAEGMGAPRQGVRSSQPVAEVKDLIATFRKMAREWSPVEVLAAFYAYESQVPRVAAEKARGLREIYGVDNHTLAYFTLHQTADVYHAQEWKKQIDQELQAAGSASSEKALDAAEKAAEALWHSLDGIERLRQAQTA